MVVYDVSDNFWDSHEVEGQILKNWLFKNVTQKWFVFAVEKR
jgi:hypothetical protein